MNAEYLRNVLDYDPETGNWLWKWRHDAERKWNLRWANKPAGSKSVIGYWAITINKKAYYGHRLAWLWMTGSWPTDLIDHKNETRDDNRWSNLRAATKSENMNNRGATKINTVGLKGVGWNARLNKYKAQIRVDGRNKHLGMFDTKELAHLAYAKAALEHHGEFANSGVCHGTV